MTADGSYAPLIITLVVLLIVFVVLPALIGLAVRIVRRVGGFGDKA
jgi:hypothetical protein